MGSSDGETRDLVTSRPGAGWDFALARHPFFEHERPLGPHYTVYNRRLCVGYFDQRSVEEGYWTIRQKVGILHCGELVVQFKGPDALNLLNKILTRDVAKIKPGRCGYGLACYDDGGLIIDGVLLRIDEDLFWYVQADGDFYGWSRALSIGMDVEITVPDVFVSQVQGPNALKLLDAAARDGLPEDFTYYGIAQVDLGGQEYLVTRTGFTNELGWELYSEPYHDADALWDHLRKHGEPFGLDFTCNDSIDIRRIEAGILNAGSDFDHSTTPFDFGLSHFVDEGKDGFLGKDALATASRGRRQFGIKCPEGEMMISGLVYADGASAGKITAAAMSPYLGYSIGYVLLDKAGLTPGAQVDVACRDGTLNRAELVEPPFYDKDRLIPRGKHVDIPTLPL
ncbi:MAG: aminomethyltransferase family protein [Pseudomonadota bacterium]